MNLAGFSLGILSDHWRKALWIAVGFALCWPVASCVGKREATAAYALKVKAAAEETRRAASQAELAAALADIARASKTKDEADELRKLIDETQSDAGVGPATAAVLQRLRERRDR
jgi:hypothetical protein